MGSPNENGTLVFRQFNLKENPNFSVMFSCQPSTSNIQSLIKFGGIDMYFFKNLNLELTHDLSKCT